MRQLPRPAVSSWPDRFPASRHMKLVRSFVMMALVAATLADTSAVQSPPSGAASWPPGLQQVSDESPARSPDAEMKTFFLPPGYRVELVASEPMVEEPILIDWDAKGRMWVIEMLGYMQDLPATNEREPNGRISVLEDTNRDGRMDKKTVFLDGLVLPRALKVLDKGVLVGEPPHLWLARDTNGDLEADSKELVCDCYGTALGNVEHNQNGLLWAMDNWMYTSEGDTYYRFKDGKIETRKTLSRGQWGATQDDFGHVYRNSNSSALHVDLLPDAVLPAQPESRADPGQLRIHGRPGRAQCHVPGAAEPRRQSGVSDRTAACRRHARHLHRRRCAARVSWRPAAVGIGGQRVRRRALRQSRQPHHRERRRHEPARATGRMPAPNSSPRPTSGSGRSISPLPPTAPSTSSTCITASFSRKGSSPSTCATTSSRTSSKRRSTSAASGASCTTARGGMDRRRSHPSRRRSWSAGSVTRMGGGATLPSSCWCNAPTRASCPR